MTMIRVTETGTVWPYSVAQLRLDEPTRGFSDNPTDAQLAGFGVFRVAASEPPVIDTAVERLVEIEPELEGGVWTQQWERVPLSEAEQAAIFRAANPPEWQAFAMAVWAQPAIGAVLRAGLQNDQTAPLAFALPEGLGQAATLSEYATFTNAVHAAVGAGLLSGELLETLQWLAVQYHLPAEFIAGLEVQP